MRSSHPRRVLVIGGGPSGLVTLRNLLEHGHFDRVELVERRDDIGGVWYLDEPDTVTTNDAKPRWPSPSYPGMIGNILPEFMSFSDFPFPPLDRPDTGIRSTPARSIQPFPTLGETHDYLRKFAEPYLASGLIRLNIEVISVDELEEGKGWRITLRDWNRSNDAQVPQVREEVWDGVVIAVGWHDNPVWPDGIKGLEELLSHQPDLSMHAMAWRGPQNYGNKRVLVVGNANSSNDMAAQLASVVLKPLYRSIRRPAFPGFPSLPDERIRDVAAVEEFVVRRVDIGGHNDGIPSSAFRVDVKLIDGSDIKDIDVVLFGTGYKPYPSFIHVLAPSVSGEPSSTASDQTTSTIQHPAKELIPLVSPQTRPGRIPSLHRFILYAYNTTLSFIGAPMAFTPFPLADLSSTWLALAWTGEIAYPATVEGRLVFEKERLKYIEDLRRKEKDPTSFLSYNVLSIAEEDYADSLRDDIVAARPELGEVYGPWAGTRFERRNAMYQIRFESLKAMKELEEKALKGLS